MLKYLVLEINKKKIPPGHFPPETPPPPPPGHFLYCLV